ncbi:MAG: WS/DGAT/MGAT family O-acyltransferase [Alphaproteobacteria bacterium]
MEQLSALDASFLYLENERVSNHIGGLYIYDQSTVPGGKLRFRQILTYLAARIHRAPRYRQKIANVPLNLDHPYWVDDDRFDLEYHVRHVALPQPGDWRQLCILASRIYDRPLDMNRPLWSMHVVEGLDNVEGLPPGSFAIITKLHHAAIDGVSSVAMNTALHETEPGLRQGDPEPWNPSRPPNEMELLGRAYMNNLAQPMKFMQVMAESVPASTRLLASLGEDALKVQSTAGDIPKTRFNREISGHRTVNGISVDLEDIRTIKNAVRGATVNDAVIAITGGALRRYLDAKKELPEDQSLVTLSPVSVRSGPADARDGGNEVAGMLASLGTNIADPLARLEAVRNSTANSKELTNAIGARLMTDFSQFIPSATTGMAARLFSQMGVATQLQPTFNTVVTNVPGPQQPLYFCGAELVNQYGLGIVQDAQALFHTVLSYNGKVTITAMSDREVMPDPEFYISCLREAFMELKDAAAPPRKPAPARAPRKPAAKAAPKRTTAKKPATRRRRKTPPPSAPAAE